METVTTVAELRRRVGAARALAGSSGPGTGDPIVGLVPTMGYLHEGHLSLVDRARRRCALVVMSLFVNPTQFGPDEDLATYPRDPERDATLARERGVDLLFAPPAGEVYPDGDTAVHVVPGPLADRLCGRSRPGHFQGVLTVVAKLFGMAQPDVAVFGQKDYQQATLIRRMVRDLDLPVHVDVAPVVREPDGLALSSRNVYLGEEERVRARSLSAGLSAGRAAFERGLTDADELKSRVRGTMTDAGVEPEYVELVDPDDLEPLRVARAGAVLAVAGRVGATRLIDNVILGQSE
jgi:pantoate--beta-alanine ligase